MAHMSSTTPYKSFRGIPLSVCLFIHLFVSLSVYPSWYMSTHQLICKETNKQKELHICIYIYVCTCILIYDVCVCVHPHVDSRISVYVV